MEPINPDGAATLLEHVARVEPGLLPVCRWLVLGRRLAPLILSTQAKGDDSTPFMRAPTLDDLVRLLHTMEGTTPELEANARSIVAESELGAQAEVEAGLDRLLDADPSRWAHPTQVLSRPYPELSDLLACCLRRLEDVLGAERRQLVAVRKKLERAVRIEGNARRRRGLGVLPEGS